MKISDFLNESHILPTQTLMSQKAILKEFSNMAAGMTGLDCRVICRKLYEREQIGSTGIGGGVAMPHAKLEGLSETSLFLYINKNKIAYDAPDDQGVDIFFCLLIPEHSKSEHLQIMANLARMMKDQDLCDRLRNAGKKKAIYNLIVNEGDYKTELASAG